TSGVVMIALGVGSAAVGTLMALAPAGVVAAVAGLALIGTLAASLRAALAEAGEQIPAVVTFATAASGVTMLGVSAAFWALLAGLAVRAVLRSGRRDPP
ncbi:benzoate/H(+) symporter BenE family transporter, partial [Gordonia sp. (in: high G+C Gram-positive bacteria)]|uniref:benzoate/H(+) symporter BenE family transporter n=1 Tax=Gordonia sp. (in: high G+C Gram-positive bacteria) TaxID=84139 RepID=UPI002635571D